MEYHLGYIKLNIKLQVGNDMKIYNKVLARRLLKLMHSTMKSFGLTIEKIDDKLHLFENCEPVGNFDTIEDIYKYINKEYD